MTTLRFPLISFIFYILFFIFSSSADAAETLSYIHQDHLGSTSLITDSTGKILSKEVYYPYGSTRSQFLQPTTNNLQLSERKYTGQVSDTDETGLYYYNSRYYNPQIAKFTQADTANDGSNRYAYVRNNPIALIDPSGHQSAFPGKDELPPDASKDISNSWQNTLSALNKRNEVMMQPSYYIPAIALGGTTLVGLGALAAPVISSTVLSSPAALGVLAAFNIISDTITQGACLAGNSASCGEVIAAAQMDPTGLAGPAALIDYLDEGLDFIKSSSYQKAMAHFTDWDKAASLGLTTPADVPYSHVDPPLDLGGIPIFEFQQQQSRIWQERNFKADWDSFTGKPAVSLPRSGIIGIKTGDELNVCLTCAEEWFHTIQIMRDGPRLDPNMFYEYEVAQYFKNRGLPLTSEWINNYSVRNSFHPE